MSGRGELKPCPFCDMRSGLNALSDDDIWWYVSCSTCGATGGYGATKAKAIAAWNRRAGRSCSPKFFDNLRETNGSGDAWAVCSECGWLLCVLTEKQEWPRYCPGCGAKVVDE